MFGFAGVKVVVCDDLAKKKGCTQQKLLPYEVKQKLHRVYHSTSNTTNWLKPPVRQFFRASGLFRA